MIHGIVIHRLFNPVCGIGAFRGTAWEIELTVRSGYFGFNIRFEHHTQTVIFRWIIDL
ncbi:MAG: hypothetical protein U5N56_08655 [Candidatus Marinimicrobia bacterium]|nr:hypothetical protein [Candidatus Neomarinimicrobiota bacterium]